MLCELHILQNFSPSNLNRDDTGAPKDCEFGGIRRGRISSQCLKRAVRAAFSSDGLLSEEQQATRSRRFLGDIAQRLEKRGRSAEDALDAARVGLEAIGLKFQKDTDATEYLLFLGWNECEQFADAIEAHWDDVLPLVVQGRATRAPGAKAVKPGKLGLDKKELLRSLDGGRAVDLALFGRMVADTTDLNVDAAASVAHALSTNAVSVEFDFFTAVDDLQGNDESGAAMMGTVEFNSACYYRYSQVDVGQLLANLHDDRELASTALRQFMTATIQAVPSGKQHSMAAYNPPSLILAVVREDSMPWSLANAFVRPVRPGRSDLVTESVRALDGYWGKLHGLYGASGIVSTALVTTAEEQDTPVLAAHMLPDVAAVVERTVEATART